MPDSTILDTLARNVREKGNTVFREFGTEKLTYAEFDDITTRLAKTILAELNTLTPQPPLSCGETTIKEPIAVMGERSMELMLAIWSIIKTGHPYFPVNLALPTDPLSESLEYCRLVVDIGDIAETKINTETRGRLRIAPFAPLANTQKDIPLPEVKPDDACYVLTTSGTTGKPKHVPNTHAGICNRLKWIIEWLSEKHPEESLSIMLKTPTSFDVSVIELLWPGRVVIAPPDIHTNPLKLIDSIIAEKIDIIHFVPPMLDLFLSTAESLDETKKANFKSTLKHIFASGQSLPYATVDRCITLLDIKPINFYGPAEAGVDVTKEECGRNETGLVSIGKAALGCEIFLLDESELPSNKGEIVIGGIQLAVGYLGNAEETEKRFKRITINGTDHRVYFTGDYGTQQADGTLLFSGRKDRQIKLNGVRIELEAIEAEIRKMSDIENAHVACVDDMLTAYIVPRANSTLAKQIDSEKRITLREFLEGRLPANHIPGEYCSLDKFPLTAHGKLDTGALKAQLAERATPPPTPTLTTRKLSLLFSDPQNEAMILSSLKNIIQHVLGSADEDRSFIEMGMNSLRQAWVITNIEIVLKRAITFKDLKDHPTIAMLTGHLKKLPVISTQLTLDRNYRGASSTQRSLYATFLRDPKDPSYNIKLIHEVSGPLQVNLLVNALRETIKRHDILRTHFETREGKLEQCIKEASVAKTFPVKSITLDSEEAVKTLVKTEFSKPFDLNRNEPLFNAHIIHCGEKHFIFFCFHHIIFDGLSETYFIEELSKRYNAALRDEVCDWPETPPYTDFSQREQALSQDISRVQILKTYWRGELKRPQKIELPGEKKTRAITPTSYAGDEVRHPLSRAYKQRCDNFCQSHKVTLFVKFFTDFLILIQRLSRESDIMLSTGASLRYNDAETLGHFISILPLRVDVQPSDTVEQLLQKVSATITGALEHRELPFEEIVSLLGSLLPDIAIVHGQKNKPFTFHNCSTTEYPLPTQTSKGPLTLYIEEGQRDLEFWFEFNTNRFDKARIQQYMDYLIHVSEYTLAHPNAQVQEIPLLTQENLEKCSILSGPTVVIPEKSNTFVKAFRLAAQEDPAAVALEYENKFWTRARLNLETDHLALEINKFLTGPLQPIVVVYTHRNHFVPALLAALKAGSAYLPLNENTSRNKITEILKDSKAALIITESDLIENIPTDYQEKTLAINLLDLGNRPALSEEQEKTLQTIQPLPENLAYVIYTSGTTTGAGSGVLVEHAAFMNMADHMKHFFGDQSRSLFAFNPSFDGAVAAISSLLYGTLIVTPYQATLPGQFSKTLIEKKITRAIVVPTILTHSQAPKNLTDLILMVAGEKIPFETLQKWEAYVHHNAWGLTETACHTADSTITNKDITPPIGLPIQNVQIYILNTADQLCPPGIPGEICVGGIGLARGYLNRPELDSRLIETRFGKVFRTGDLGILTLEGSLQFLGRLDSQLKIHGFRVEPAEIEQAIKSYENIVNVIVTPRYDGNNRFLVAYIVPEAGKEIKIADLSDWLRSKLEPYKLPESFVTIREVPVNANGKTDFERLPPAQKNLALQVPYQAPQSNEENILIDIISEVSGIDSKQISTQASLRELGIKSINIVQLQHRIKTKLAVDVGLDALLQDDMTPKKLAILLIAKRAAVEAAQKKEGAESVASSYGYDVFGI